MDKRQIFFDSHCHLNDSRLFADLDLYLERATASGIGRILVAACDELSSYQAVQIAKNYSNRVELIASAGVHPHDAHTADKGLSEEMYDLAQNPYVRAIGECGLDFYYDNSPRDVQKKVFCEQIQWAKAAQKPLIVHLRNAETRSGGDAYRDGMALLKEQGAEACGGVIHCFSGELQDAYNALDLGFYISFAGPITYPKSNVLRECAQKVPLDRILCETDAPYLAPQKHRGKQNEPSYVRYVYELLSELRSLPLDRCSEIVWENGVRLFGSAGNSHV